MGLFGKKYAIEDIPTATRAYLNAEVERIEKSYAENMCSGYLYAKAVAGEKALASKKLTKTDLQVLLEIVLARREMMLEKAEQQGMTEEDLAEYDYDFKHNSKARKLLKDMLS